MSKRFPVPTFSYEQYKNMDWREPAFLEAEDRARLAAAAQSGHGPFGGYPVRADTAFYERFKLKGDHRHAVMCLLPTQPVRLIGRSHAWPIQQALIVDSLDAERAKVIHEWRTPRPMNTRLGPDDGVAASGGVLYVICSHRYADHWIVNRTLVDGKGLSGPSGFGVLSASDDAINDFHACNLWFDWQ